MGQRKNPRGLRSFALLVTTRIYRAALHLYPAAHQREYGQEMAETFEQRARDAAELSLLQVLILFLRECSGLVLSALDDRFRVSSATSAATAAVHMAVGSRREPRTGSSSLMLQELKHAFRRLRRSPGFAAATVLTLAVGIGGNVAVFAVLNGVVLRPLPYPDSNQLVRVAADVQAVGAEGIDIPMGFWLAYREHNESFSEIGLYQPTSVNIADTGAPERVEAARVSGSMHTTIDVSPLLGRGIVEADEQPGAAPVAVLSHSLWSRRYDSDRNVLGRTFRIDGVDTEVVGVLPRRFAFPEPETQLWLPLTVDRSADPPVSFSYASIARLAPGASLDSATADLTRITQQLPDLFGNVSPQLVDNNVVPALEGLKENVSGDVADTLWILLAALGMVLLMACANVANLFLVRSEGRRREVTLRTALGANRADLLRHLLAESVVIGLAAGAAGLAIAAGGVRLLVAFGPDDVPRLHEVGISLSELAFTAAVTIIAATAFSLLPLLRFLGAQRFERLLNMGERSTTSSKRRGTDLLIVAQISLALMLLVAAALFTLSLRNLLEINPGFDANRVLTFRFSLPQNEYGNHAQRAQFHQQLLDQLEALPGVESAGLARCLPLQGWCGGNPVTSPDTALRREDYPDIYSIKPVSPGYFETLGIALEQGRFLERRDHEARTGAAILNHALAERLFPEQSALGKRIYPGEIELGDDQPWYTVVGVVGTTKRVRLDEEPAGILYLPMIGTDDRVPALSQVAVAVRTRGEPLTLAPSIRKTLSKMAPDTPVAALEPMTAVLRRASARIGFTATLIGIAALSALLLGAIGVYGVVSQSVGSRTAEIGLRLAVGANRLQVVLMLVAHGLALTVAGITLGLIGTFASGRLVANLLYQVRPSDPLPLICVSAVLVAVALVASYLPARRAARIEPLDALRSE